MSDQDKIVELLLRILDRQQSLELKIDSHVSREEDMLGGMAAAFTLLPDGKPDFAGHQSYHAALIEAAKDRAVLFRELRNDLVKKSLWGLLMVLAALIAYWWKHEVKAP